MSKFTSMLTRVRHGAFARVGAGAPTLADHIDAATALAQGSSRGDIGNMPMGECPPAWESKTN